MNEYTRVRQEPTKYDPYNDTEDVYEVNDRGEDYVLENVNQQNNDLNLNRDVGKVQLQGEEASELSKT